jgi:hypothetical protein
LRKSGHRSSDEVSGLKNPLRPATADSSDPSRPAPAHGQRLRLQHLLIGHQQLIVKAPIAPAIGVFLVVLVDEGDGIRNAGPRGAVAVGLVVAVGKSE